MFSAENIDKSRHLLTSGNIQTSPPREKKKEKERKKMPGIRTAMPANRD